MSTHDKTATFTRRAKTPRAHMVRAGRGLSQAPAAAAVPPRTTSFSAAMGDECFAVIGTSLSAYLTAISTHDIRRRQQ